MKMLAILALVACLGMGACTESKMSKEEKKEVEVMDSTEKQLEKHINKLEEQTRKVEESIEKVDKEFE